MRRNMKVIQINGFRGIFLTLFVISCLVAGFIAFPAFVAMNLWNFVVEKTDVLPTLDFAKGLLLWAIIAFSFYIFNKKKLIVSFNAKQELSEPEINEVVQKIKLQALKNKILQQKNISAQNETVEEKKEVSIENTDK